MIKLQEIVGLPTLQYHLDNKLTLSECVYRYSSDSFIQLFAEARKALRDGKITLNEQDLDLLENTDIGEYGMYEGEKVPLDLPMVQESIEGWPTTVRGNDDIIWVKTKVYEDDIVNYTPYFKGYNIDFGGVNFRSPELLQRYIKRYALSNNVYNKYKFKEEVPLPTNIDEAEYRGKDVTLNKPKRGGSKKFVVYVKDPKSKNIKKVSFGGTTGLNVKIDEPGARSSFAARHQCDKKKDKTKPGYWACNIGRYWKSLGGSRNFSGYW